MCLDAGHVDIVKGVGIGYKRFGVRSDGKLIGFCYSRPGKNYLYPKKTWVTDTKTGKILNDDDVGYSAGFHIYLEKPLETGLDDFFEVKFKNIVAIGKDGGTPTVIAKDMYIIGKVK